MLLASLIVASAIVYRSKIKGAKEPVQDEEEMIMIGKSRPGLVPISGIFKGQIDMPTEEEFDRLFQYQDKLESKLTTYQGQRNNDKMCPHANPFHEGLPSCRWFS